MAQAQRNTQQKSTENRQTGESRSQSESGQSQAIERRSQGRGSLSLNMPQFLLDPFSMIRSLSEEMNRMLAPTANRGTDGFREGSDASIAWVPTIEVEQRNGRFIVSAELPGIEEGDVTVEVDDDVLVIRGERQYVQEDTEGGVRRTERRYGQFYRAIPLPEGVDPNQAEARINNGVLEVSFPLADSQNERRQIPVSSGGQPASGSESNQRRNEGSKAA
jgi:HSP20 family protein